MYSTTVTLHRRRAATPSALVFEAASSSEGGPEGKWNMVIVEAPFSYDTMM